VPGAEDGGHVGPDFKYCLYEFVSGHFGHGHIGDDEVDLIRISTEKFQCLRMIGGNTGNC